MVPKPGSDGASLQTLAFFAVSLFACAEPRQASENDHLSHVGADRLVGTIAKHMGR